MPALPIALIVGTSLMFGSSNGAPAVALVLSPPSAAGDAGPREPWLASDPADSLYRAGRQLLLNGNYSGAARVFATIASKYSRSGYAPDALYWQAFALYRIGGNSNLRAAAAAADRAKSFTKWSNSSDLATLSTRIRAALARGGDADAAASIITAADAAMMPEPPEAPEAPMAPAGPMPPIAPDAPASPDAPRRPSSSGRSSGWGRSGGSGRSYNSVEDDDRCNRNGDDDVKVAAINGLLQMDSDRALPILRKVLARRDEASVCLRRKAVFLVAQKRGPDTEDVLLDAVRNDPDAEVRSQGVFWLSQVPSARSTAALDSILRSSNDDELRNRAIFALSQQSAQAALNALRTFASRNDAPTPLREQAIFWLGQRGNGAELPFLRELYGKVDNNDLREKILFAASQAGPDGRVLLLEIAKDGKANTPVRKQALFWLSQSKATSTADIVSLYSTFADREMRDQVIFALSQRRDGAAIDKLIEIARKDPDPELRKKAVFWLGQSRDPRAAKAIEEILDQ